MCITYQHQFPACGHEEEQMWLCRNYYFNKVCQCNVQEVFWVKKDICSKCHTRLKSVEGHNFLPNELEDEVQIMRGTKAPGMPLPRPQAFLLAPRAQCNTGYANRGIVMQTPDKSRHTGDVAQCHKVQALGQALERVYGAPAAYDGIIRTNSQVTTQSDSAQIFSTMSAATQCNSQNMPGGGFYQEVDYSAIDQKATPLEANMECQIREVEQTCRGGSDDSDIIFVDERRSPRHLTDESNAGHEGSCYDSNVTIKVISKPKNTGSFNIPYHLAKDNHAPQSDICYSTDVLTLRNSKQDEDNGDIGAPYRSTVDCIAAHFDKVYSNHATSKRGSKQDEDDGGSAAPYHFASGHIAAQAEIFYGSNATISASSKQNDNDDWNVRRHLAECNSAQEYIDYDTVCPSKRNGKQDVDNGGSKIPMHPAAKTYGMGMGNGTRAPSDGDKRFGIAQHPACMTSGMGKVFGTRVLSVGDKRFKIPAISSKQQVKRIKGAYGRVTKSAGRKKMQASKDFLDKLNGENHYSCDGGGL